MSAFTAFAISAFGEPKDIQVIQVPIVTEARIQFFRLPWPSTRFVTRKVLQDNQGFLWLSAADGLRRYDGYGFLRVPGDSEGRNAAASLRRVAHQRPVGCCGSVSKIFWTGTILRPGS